MKLTQYQKDLLEKVVDGTWTLNQETGLVDVDGNVQMIYYYIKTGKLPIKFGEVSGNFDCIGLGCISLEGSPVIVHGNFYCSQNLLTSLKGAPRKVHKNMYCYGNRLKDLIGSPEYVGDSFLAHRNPLVSIEGFPTHIGVEFGVDLDNLPLEEYDKTFTEIELMKSRGIKIYHSKGFYEPYYENWLRLKMLEEFNA